MPTWHAVGVWDSKILRDLLVGWIEPVEVPWSCSLFKGLSWARIDALVTVAF
jgi:hypothetical protein